MVCLHKAQLDSDIQLSAVNEALPLQEKVQYYQEMQVIAAINKSS